jgi:heme oxygenase (biliverdin-producing, ferredoxin)
LLAEALLDETLQAYELNAAMIAILRPQSTQSAAKQNTLEKPRAEAGYSIASVVTFMLAVGLAHFMLVVGGYTGDRGYAKFELAQQWLTDIANMFRKV